MLWSYSEVLAYINEEDGGVPNVDVDHSDVLCAEISSPTEAFGGFRTWPERKTDFLLIAENSEIHGPNPLFTIPYKTQLGRDLNQLTTQILSADYQGLSNNRSIAGKVAQLLMPDIASDTHVAAHHFILFDSEARGFVRPVCLSYVTSDKSKLINCAEAILEGLSKAASFIQHSNIKHSKEDLKNILKQIKLNKSVPNENSGFSKNELVSKEVQDILHIMDSFQLKDTTEWLILSFLESLKDNASSIEIKNFSFISPPFDTTTENCVIKSEKQLKSLLVCSPGGIILAIYHLYVMYQYFKRKHEDIYLSEGQEARRECSLHFGACIKPNKWGNSNASVASTYRKCIINSFNIPLTFELDSCDYIQCLDFEFEKILWSFLMGSDSVSENEDAHGHAFVYLDSSYENSSVNGYAPDDFVNNSAKDVCRHIVPLSAIWEGLDALERDHPGTESAFLEILKAFRETERLFYALLTNIPIILVSVPDNAIFAQNFLVALSVFVPRKIKRSLLIDLDVRDVLTKESITNMIAGNVCLHGDAKLESIVPSALVPSLCILNLRNGLFTGPYYTGCLLSKLEQRINNLPPNGPAFPVIVNILCDIEQKVYEWNAFTSSCTNTDMTTCYMLSKGITKHDVEILQNLSDLCK